MKKSIILSATVATLFFGACNNSPKNVEQTNSPDSVKTENVNSTQSFNLDTTKLKSGEVFYQCEMHADINSEKPGICPKCEMDLSELKKN